MNRFAPKFAWLLLSRLIMFVKFRTEIFRGYDFTEVVFLARDAFVRTNRRAIAMMFVRLSVCLSVCPSGTGVHCDHTVHFSADFSLQLASPMFWLP